MTETAPAIEMWPIEKPVPYEGNPRKLTEKAISKVAASIREFGFRSPIIVDTQGIIIAGHTRLQAAKSLKMRKVPVLVADMSPEKAKAYRLADNRVAQETQWDDELLGIELQALDDMGFDLDFTGFDSAELTKLLSSEEDIERAEVTPDVPTDAVSVLGDVWILGRHRLICGDSTSATDVERVMAGQAADFVFTSPPYAQQRNYGSEDGIADWDALMQGVFSILPTKQGAQVLVNLGLVHHANEWQPYWGDWISWMRSVGWRSFGWYVWDQGPGLAGDWNGRLAPSHEFIFHFNKSGLKANKTKEKKPENVKYKDHGSGLRRADGKMSGVSNREASMQTHKIPDSVIRVMRHKARGIEVGHPAVFPVALVKELSDAYTKADDRLFEPFSGSGSSIMAAEVTGRICHAIEIHPPYTDLAILRWQDFTGQKAIHEETGKTFEELKNVRYDAAADSKGSFDVMVDTLREQSEAKKGGKRADKKL